MLIINKNPASRGLMMPATLPSADAVPTAVPLTDVLNTSGVYP